MVQVGQGCGFAFLRVERASLYRFVISLRPPRVDLCILPDHLRLKTYFGSIDVSLPALKDFRDRYLRKSIDTNSCSALLDPIVIRNMVVTNEH